MVSFLKFKFNTLTFLSVSNLTSSINFAAIGDMSILRTFDCTPRNQLDHGYFLKLERITKNRCPRMYEDFKFGASDVQCWSTSSSIIGSWVKDEMVKNENWYLPSKNFHHSSCDVSRFVDWARRRDKCTSYVN
ncbi:uncharacterized protein LOC103524674 [Diaphorina citri]|uniref:Uncharacterized protein LOC103524674 n=1 Tax=Diaphorina citri TaxID=121845 RepID=A0A1S3DU26_DIACI|nr:uncharacterized protein LOC103524674 [Diaphorina citri]KAI5749533.1 hypothetical protein M8J76_008077 [Diaphorina citri]KAI5755495.1 hypothetical protein M8J77_017432 [Diaphorina citri]